MLSQQQGVDDFHCILDSPFSCHVLASFQIVTSYSQAVLSSSFFTYNKSEPLGHNFMGNDRMDSRLEEGFRKIPAMWTAPSFCSATAGTGTQRSGELLHYSWAAYCKPKASISPPLQTQSRTSLVNQGQGPASRAQVCVLRGSRKPGEDNDTFQEGSNSFSPPPWAAACRLRGGRAGGCPGQPRRR